ncbi:uncharacterized protein B0H18DRAFT_1083451 [Fomitopsis serialis]|uniref:uncharacterized protein n=1 Tax=Fomitopsis serialis TaxID=139415 RepID=UPI002007A32D|nr:uncharacterized protein B0H18DRAFT_1083451 [Neoantrodia serialis]KAH9931415.1 hypothetical protein B0H18DRAFT_1083451 [Neoantrodia serialis]
MRGWIEAPLAAYLRPLLNRLRQRCAPTTFGKITDEDTWATLERARQDASMAPPRDFVLAQAPTLELDPRFELTGARLDALTQALAYHGILELRGTETRLRTHSPPSTPLTHGAIWTSLRHRDFSRAFAVFLWKVMHDGLKCGTYWDKIQGYEHRAQCGRCGLPETIQHILFDCEAVGQSLVWSIVGGIWKKKAPDAEWRALTPADFLSVGLKTWKDNKGRFRPGATRLWRIMISEAAHLIWKLRCERVIGHAEEDDWEHSQPLVWNKLQYVLNSRLAQDVESVRRKYGDSAIDRRLVLATWNRTLRDEPALPEDWTTWKGF